MRRFNSIFLGICFVLFSAKGSAGFEGSISFSEQERIQHRASLAQILESATNCLEADLSAHLRFFQEHGIARFYGDRSAFARLGRSGQQAELRRLGKNPALLDQMAPTSCVGLALKCFAQGFNDAGQTAIWLKIRDFTRANDQDGTAMQHALRELGWRVLFWNPNPAFNQRWDDAEKAADPANRLRFWGYHTYRMATIRNSGNYYFNRVDDATTLVNFGVESPRFLESIPLFLGTAHTGYHVFPGFRGRVIEAHSTRLITDSRTIESAEFNPLAEDGAPAGAYRSGLIAVPPGY